MTLVSETRRRLNKKARRTGYRFALRFPNVSKPLFDDNAFLNEYVVPMLNMGIFLHNIDMYTDDQVEARIRDVEELERRMLQMM